MAIFKSIIPILFFLIVNSASSVTFKKNFGFMLPITYLITIVLMFISQLVFKTFNVGFYLLIVLFICSLYVLYKHKDEKEYIFTNGFYLFLGFGLVFLFINFGRQFFWDDELGFWGKMVKEMLRLDKFYYVNESSLRGHNDYPPFIPLFELIWSKLTLGFNEANTTIALHMYEFGLLFPMVFDGLFKDKKLKERLLINLLISIGLVSIVIYLDSANVFNTIYTDSLIGIEFAYCAYLIYTNKTNDIFGIIGLALGLSAIIMTKQVGIAFVLLGVFYLFIHNINNLKNKNVLISLCVCLLMPILFYLVWNNLIKPYDIVKQFDLSKVSISGFIEIFNNQSSYQFEALKLYINALFKENLYNYPIPVTFLSSLLVEILLLEILKRFTNKDKQITIFEIICFLGTAGYAFMMMILYVFCYPEREALILISYHRYLSSMTTGLFLSILFMYIVELKDRFENTDIKKAIIGLLVVLVLFDSNKLLNFAPQVLLGNRFVNYQNLANKFEKELEKGSYVYILYNHDIADSYPAFVSYYLDDIYMCKVNTDFYKNEYKNNNELNEAIKELGQYDYIYVVESSDTFNNYFSSLNDGNNYKSNTIYKVNNTNGTITLKEYK